MKCPALSGYSEHQPEAGEDRFPNEAQHVPGALPGSEHLCPNTREPGEPCGPAPGSFPLGDGGSQGQKASDA